MYAKRALVGGNRTTTAWLDEASPNLGINPTSFQKVSK